jgi:muramoyltetrapeptide carboxypeptidase
MGLRVILVALCASALSSRAPLARAQDDAWLKASALRPGDVIRFVAPAGPSEAERAVKAKKRFEAEGFRVVLPPNLSRRTGYLAGSDEERAAELNEALRDPDARAIFPCRGGYGLSRILDRIDYEALRRAPKIITGYSDLTALHLAVARKCRLITFHSPMPESSLWRDDGAYAFAASSFARALFADRYRSGAAGYLIDLPRERPAPVRLVSGKATGRLVGGNLTLICATLGTPYAIEPKGNLLFVEDISEAPYRVDRMFAQLRLAGVLDQIAGLIVGSFDETDTAEVERVVRGYGANLKVPVVLGFPVGHIPTNATLPHGARAELDADLLQLRLLEDPVHLEKR